MKRDKLTQLGLGVLAALLFTGCQAAPEAQKTEEEPAFPQEENEVILDLQSYEDSFTGNDGKVQFNISALGRIPTGSASAVEVVPHFISPEEAKQAAQAFFGAEAIYETAFVPTPEAAESWPMTPCQWTYYPLGHYTGGSEDLMYHGKPQILAIDATSAIGGTAYKFVAATRQEDDFLLNHITAFLSQAVPQGSQWMIRTEEDLCSGQIPDEVQMQAVQQKASAILDRLGFGSWEITECFAEEQLAKGEYYRIILHAVPVVGETPVLRYRAQDQVAQKAPAALPYFLTDAEFVFTGSGELLHCKIQSPIDVTEIQGQQPILPFDALMAAAKVTLSEQVSEKILEEYGARLQQLGSTANCTAQVNVTEFRFGLTRTDAPGEKSTYIYVPSVAFYGNYQIMEEGTDIGLYSSEAIDDANDIPLLVLNSGTGEPIYTQSGKLFY